MAVILKSLRTNGSIWNWMIPMLKTSLWLFLFWSVFIFQIISTDSEASSLYLNLDDEGLALQGYDPVSYHRQGPEKGKKEFIFQHDGATYLFSSRNNLETFKASPNTYLPAFGGWCAWAMLDGEKVDVDPKTYKIINGRSYLFYNSFFVNTLSKWNSRALDETEEFLVNESHSEWEMLKSLP